MLIEFRVANHRSILEEQVLSFEAANVGDPEDQRPRVIAGYPKKVLPVAAIYGANGSGKSNVLSALAFMALAVDQSHRMWAPEGGVPRTPFAWGGGPEAPSLFEVVLVLDGVRYQYGFTADDQAFLEEWLYVWPKGRKQTWFERDGARVSFGDGLQGERHAAAKVMRPNSLYLSAAAQNNLEQLTRLARWFDWLRWSNLDILPLTTRAKNLASLPTGVSEFVRRHVALRRLFPDPTPGSETFGAFRSMLKAADVGIDDVRLVGEGAQLRVETRHGSDAAWLNLLDESSGTQTLFHLIPGILNSIRGGSILVLDEIEANLHPSIVQTLVQLFQGKANAHGGQLLFTTHDTNALGTATGTPTLRRDQVWLTEKNPSTGATALYPLTDYKPRKEENLERGYLQGRYGAVPFVGDFGAALSGDDA